MSAQVPIRRRSDAGFTLVELMTVVLLLGVLVAIAIPAYVGARDRTAAEVCAANRKLGAQADYRFYLDNDVWSGSFADLTGGYLEHPLACPSGGVLVWTAEPTVSDPHRTLVCSIHGTGDGTEDASESPLDTFHRVSTNLIDLIEAFREDRNKWPRSFEPYNYTDLGLDPEDWEDPQNHLYFSPVGNRINVSPEEGWIITVQTPNGTTKVLTEDLEWNIVYDMKTGEWYYKSISSRNLIDIDTLTITEDPDAEHDD